MTVERETKILLALKKAWDCGYTLVFDGIWNLETEEELLAWADGEDE